MIVSYKAKEKKNPFIAAHLLAAAFVLCVRADIEPFTEDICLNGERDSAAPSGFEVPCSHVSVQKSFRMDRLLQPCSFYKDNGPK